MPTKSELAEYAVSEYWPERLEAARSRRTPPELLVRLLDDKFPAVRGAARCNSKIPLEKLEELVEVGVSHGLDDVSLACNPALTAPLLERLYLADLNRVEVMRHQNCPVSLLRLNALSGEEKFRVLAARHRKVPEDVWDFLLSDPLGGVRSAAARNKSIPPERLSVLVNDRRLSIVRTVVARTSGALQEEALSNLMRRSRSQETRWVLATHSTDSAVLERLALDRSRWIRRRVVENIHASEEVRVAAALMG